MKEIVNKAIILTEGERFYMDKVAYLKGKEIAREIAIQPKINEKFNTEELSTFYRKIEKHISGQFDNSSKIEFYCCYQ